MQLNVLQVLPALEVGGVERGTLEIARALVERGYGSSVISAGGKLVHQLEQEGSRHLQLGIGLKSPLTCRHIPAVRRFILENNINVIHVRSRMPAWINYLAWRTIPQAQRPVLVSTVHGPYSVNAYSKIMLRTDYIIAISEFIKKYILDNYPDTDENRITLIHRGVDNKVFSPGFKPRADWSAPWAGTAGANDTIVTLPGRITRWKGQMDFVEIIARLRQQGIAVHGVMAGGAEKRRLNFLAELKQRIHELGLDTNISLIGQRDDMKEIMHASDIVLSLAKTPEAFGRTALEALCLGTPVVAYDHGGAHEVLTRLFPEGLSRPDDIDAAAQKVRGLLEASPGIAENDLFTLDNMINKTIRLYIDAANRQGHS